jgi:hypothetical protein
MSEWSDYISTYSHIKAFVKGPPGGGKTYLSASITQVCKTLFVDVEGGLISAHPIINTQNLTLRCIRETDAKSFFGRLTDAVNEAMSGQYEALVIDSLTEIVGRMEDEYSSASKNGKLEFGDWYVLMDRVKKFGRLLRDMKAHVIVTSLTKPTKQEDSTSIFEPVLPGQSCAVVPSFFDIVGLLRRGTGKSAAAYSLVTDGPSIYQVRDRTHTLAADEVIDPKRPDLVWRKIMDGLHALAGSKG